MLSENQRLQVQELILEYIGFPAAPASLRELVGAIALAGAPASVNAPRMAGWVLDHALGLPDPKVFIHVITTCDGGGILVDVHALVSRLQQDPSLWNPGAVALWVPAEWPFLDRERLRDVLAQMGRGDGPHAITIEGPDGTGKRTMAAYIGDSARDGTFKSVAAELRPDPAGGVLDGLVARLRVALRLELADETTHNEPERRAQILARELVNEAAYVNHNVWLVANVIEVNGLEAGVLRFLDELLAQLQMTPPTAPRLRVVLLANEIGRLGLKNLPPLEHRHVLPEVASSAVTAWLAAAVPGKPEGLYALSSSAVIADVDRRQPPPSKRLEWISLICRQTHDKLAAMIDG